MQRLSNARGPKESVKLWVSWPTDDGILTKSKTRGLILRNKMEACLCQDLPSANCAESFRFPVQHVQALLHSGRPSSHHVTLLACALLTKDKAQCMIEAAIMPCDCKSTRTCNIRSVMNLPQLAHETPTQSDLFSDKDRAGSIRDVLCIQQRVQR